MDDIHSARHYFVEVVLPAYAELGRILTDGFFGGRRDIAALGRAAEACLHLADHVAGDPMLNATIDGAPKSKRYIKHLADTYPAFATTQDIANSWKHRTISDHNRKIDGLSSIFERWGLIRYTDSDGHYFATRKFVFVRLRDGTELFGEDVIASCLEEWTIELIRRGVIQCAPQLPHLPRKLLRTKAPADLKMGLRIVSGEYFESKCVLLRYDEQCDRFMPLTERIGSVYVEVTAAVEASPFTAA